MFRKYDDVWVVVEPFEPPQKCRIIDLKYALDSLGGYVYSTYVLAHNDTEIEMRDEHLYLDKDEADIHWAVCFSQAYENVEKHKIFAVGYDYESVKNHANAILRKYATEKPELLMKYL
jgi:hypothetical protein